MVSMTTETATPMFKHFVPETEPPIGAVASFSYRFASGGGSSTGFLMRGQSGWSSDPDFQRHNVRTWESLTDLEARNADIQQRRPGSTAVFTAVDVRIHTTPPVDRPAERARLVKLEHAVFCAAERAGIQTEGATHTEMVQALAGLAEIRSRA